MDMSFLTEILCAFGKAILQPYGLSPQGFSGWGRLLQVSLAQKIPRRGTTCCRIKLLTSRKPFIRLTTWVRQDNPCWSAYSKGLRKRTKTFSQRWAGSNIPGNSLSL